MSCLDGLSCVRPKISILMNCYNGERYLREAIDSIVSQTLNSWEIVFIDNHSDDNSKSIAASYGDKIRYFKTPTFMTLGEARKWGISHCVGEYLCILDVDNIYDSDFLETLYRVMKSHPEYILAYSGHERIDGNGRIFDKCIPKKKSGIILKELLQQFDIEPNGAMINLAMLKDSGLSFDPFVKASEEYCLFIQLSAKYKFLALDRVLFKYRWSTSNLTIKCIDRWEIERVYTLKLLEDSNPGIRENVILDSALKEAYARAHYYGARLLFYKGERIKAIMKMLKTVGVSYKYFILLIICSCFPWLWRRIHQEYKKDEVEL